MRLQSEVYIALGLKYETILNVNTVDGLTNAASCTVKYVQVTPDKKVMGVIWVHFEDNFINKSTRALGRNNLGLIFHGHQLYSSRANLMLAETKKLPESNFLYYQLQQKQFTDLKETQYQKYV